MSLRARSAERFLWWLSESAERSALSLQRKQRGPYKEKRTLELKKIRDAELRVVALLSDEESDARREDALSALGYLVREASLPQVPE